MVNSGVEASQWGGIIALDINGAMTWEEVKPVAVL